MDTTVATLELTGRLQKAIQSAGGVIPYEEFMRRALYEPELGYYERTPGTVGRAGDFYTNVSVGSLFGELLAWQSAKWLETMIPGAHLVEIGAHEGNLAFDILTWFKAHRPAQFANLGYVIVEPSAARRNWQQSRLVEFSNQIDWVEQLPPARGVIFSNELLDAFPVRPVRWQAASARWDELGVCWQKDGFREVSFPRRADTWTPTLAPELQAVLPDGFTTESSPTAETWWSEAAQRLELGYLVTIDYGLTEDQLIVPQRAHGTRRGYHRHHLVSTNLLATPGELDLTAQVNFSRIQQVGERAGLQTIGLTPQRVRLTEIFQHTLNAAAAFGEWIPDRRRQFQTLTHPEHLGRGFFWLEQTRTLKTD